MSDNGHHDPGGHELEAVNTKMLFRLLISLSLITLLAAYAVVQWFYFQRSELEGRYAAEGSFQLKNYQTKMDGQLEGIDAVAKDVAGNPALLAGSTPPPGWMHPDDLVGGAAEAPAAAPAAPAKPAVESHEGHKHATPEGQPTEAAKPEGEPSPSEVAKPEAEGDKPEGEKADDEKADDEKADDKSGQ